MTPFFKRTTHPGGTREWLYHKISLILFLPLSLWFLFRALPKISLFFYSASSTSTSFIQWIKTPIRTLLMLGWIFSLLIHATLCLNVMIEDYIPVPWQRAACKSLLYIISWGLAIGAAVSFYIIWRG